MKKITCKILSLTIFVLITMCLTFNSFLVKADEENELYHEISRNETVVMNDVVWTNIIANTKTTMPKGWDSGYGSSTPIDVNTWYGQQINLFTIPRVLDADGNQKYEIISPYGWVLLDKWTEKYYSVLWAYWKRFSFRCPLNRNLDPL